MEERQAPRTRGFVPPRDDDERLLMRRVEELCRAAESRGAPRYTGFLSDREQDLALAAAHRADCAYGRFWGGYPGAERAVFCLEPPDAWQEEPVAVLRLAFALAAGAQPPAHRDCLGALLGLGVARRCLGDIMFDAADPRLAYVFVLEENADFLVRTFCSAGRCAVRAERLDLLPEGAFREPERTLRQATVPSLRADSVLAAMLHGSRGTATELIEAGRVEICHLPLRAGHEPVYAGDIFTVRGLGRFRLAEIGGKSKKDRIFISFYQY